MNDRPYAPSTFVASIGGLWDGSFEVKWAEGALHYHKHHHNREQREVLIPTQEQWEQLKSVLDQINVWTWKERYEQPAMDGTWWSLHVAWGDKAVETSGSNGYPTTTGALAETCDFTPVFRKYLKAVSLLLGGRTFR